MAKQSGGDLIALAQRLHQHGASIVVSIDCVDGSTSRVLPPAELPDFLESPERWTAKQWGITPDELADWAKTGGFPRCRALTKKGAHCRNSVSGSACDPDAFVELDGGLCHIHE